MPAFGWPCRSPLGSSSEILTQTRERNLYNEHPAPIRKYTPVLVAAPRMITMNARGSRIEIQKGMFDVADEEW